MATYATLRLYRGVLEHERSAGLGVALRADLVLIGRRFDVVIAEGSVGIVAIAALHQAFIHPVMEGLREVRLHVGVALIAELGLIDFQQGGFRAGAMNAVATGAAYIRLGVRRPQEVGMSSRVATEAGSVHLLRGHLAKLADLGDIPTGFNMGLPRPVATLAGCTLPAMGQRKLGVGIVRELLGYLGMA